MICCLRSELAQMEHISPSATLKQRLQNLISLRIFATISPKCCTSFVSCFNKCKTRRKAVFFPIPGSLENSFTAFSSKEEENCIAQSYSNKGRGTRRRGRCLLPKMIV